jgi:hypothetical protein
MASEDNLTLSAIRALTLASGITGHHYLMAACLVATPWPVSSASYSSRPDCRVGPYRQRLGADGTGAWSDGATSDPMSLPPAEPDPVSYLDQIPTGTAGLA